MNVFEQNVQNALKCADEIINSVNETLANASSNENEVQANVLTPATNVLTPEINVNAVLRKLELAAIAPTVSALNEPTIKEMGEEVKKIMSAGFDEFKRQTGRNMTYSEMRHAYG
jgi:hypothetical protein